MFTFNNSLKLIGFLAWCTYFYCNFISCIVNFKQWVFRVWYGTLLTTNELVKPAKKDTRRLEKFGEEEVDYWQRWVVGSKKYVILAKQMRILKNKPGKSADYRWLGDEQRGVVNTVLRKSLKYFELKFLERLNVVVLKFLTDLKRWTLFFLFPVLFCGRLVVKGFCAVGSLFVPIIKSAWRVISQLVVWFYTKYRETFIWFVHGLWFFITIHLKEAVKEMGFSVGSPFRVILKCVQILLKRWRFFKATVVGQTRLLWQNKWFYVRSFIYKCGCNWRLFKKQCVKNCENVKSCFNENIKKFKKSWKAFVAWLLSWFK